MEWYYAEGGSQKGPISDSDFQTMVGSGQITAKTLVWNSSMKNWAEYGTVASPSSAGQTATGSDGQGEIPGTTQNNFGAGGTGQTHNRDLMAMAREMLTGRWGEGALLMLCMWGLEIAGQILVFIPLLGLIAYIVLFAPIVAGFMAFFLNISRKQEAPINMLFAYFNRMGTCVAALLLNMVFVFLWSLLLIIPGIIKSIRYSQIWFIIADNPDISASEALRRSDAMMKGSCWKYFCLSLRFLGWSILCLFTLGIGYLWLGPYMMTSYANFYEDVKGKVANS